MIAYVEFADYLLIAESILGLSAEAIAHFNRISLAQSALAAPKAGFGGLEAYPDLETKSRCALLASHQEPPSSGRERPIA